MSEMLPICFVATVEKVQTMADGAIRVTLDLPDDQEPAAAALMACKRLTLAIDVDARPMEIAPKVTESYRNGEPDETDQRAARSPLDVAGRRLRHPLD